MKLDAIVWGNHGTSSTHSCFYGECYRIANGGKTGGKGRWVTGPDSCIARKREWNDKWLAAIDDPNMSYATKIKKLKDFMSQKYKPCRIFDESEVNTPVVLLTPPPILHLLLGKPNIGFILVLAWFQLGSSLVLAWF